MRPGDKDLLMESSSLYHPTAPRIRISPSLSLAMLFLTFPLLSPLPLPSLSHTLPLVCLELCVRDWCSQSYLDSPIFCVVYNAREEKAAGSVCLCSPGSGQNGTESLKRGREEAHQGETTQMCLSGCSDGCMKGPPRGEREKDGKER